MQVGDLVKVIVRIPGDAVMVNEDIGIVVDTVRMELFAPEQAVVLWSNNQYTISNMFHLEIVGKE
jgi:hypothetical protein